MNEINKKEILELIAQLETLLNRIDNIIRKNKNEK